MESYDDEDLLDTIQVGEFTGRSSETVRRWIRQGLLPAEGGGRGLQLRVRFRSVRSFDRPRRGPKKVDPDFDSAQALSLVLFTEELYDIRSRHVRSLVPELRIATERWSHDELRILEGSLPESTPTPWLGRLIHLGKQLRALDLGALPRPPGQLPVPIHLDLGSGPVDALLTREDLSAEQRQAAREKLTRLPSRSADPRWRRLNMMATVHRWRLVDLPFPAIAKRLRVTTEYVRRLEAVWQKQYGPTPTDLRERAQARGSTPQAWSSEDMTQADELLAKTQAIQDDPKLADALAELAARGDNEAERLWRSST